MAHPNEPSLEELQARKAELYTSESTDDNIRRLHAIGIQIKRRKAEDGLV
jgi:hypothetical protein